MMIMCVIMIMVGDEEGAYCLLITNISVFRKCPDDTDFLEWSYWGLTNYESLTLLLNKLFNMV